MKKRRKVKVPKLNKYATQWEAVRQRARGYVSDLQAQGFTVDDETARLLNYKGPERMTKKKLDQLRKKVTKTQLQRRATWNITSWEKVIYSTDIDDDGNATVWQQVGTSKQQGGLDVAAESDINYALVEKINKDPNKNYRELANVLNGLIGYQKSNFMTTEELLTSKVWELAKKLNGGQVPTEGTSNQYFTVEKSYVEEHYEKDPAGGYVRVDDNDPDKGYMTTLTTKHYQYEPDPNAVTENKFAFFRSVKFKSIPGYMIDEIMDIAKHPQTSEELYKQFRDSSSLRTFKAQYNKLVQQLSQQNQIPPAAVGALLWVMHTSQIWAVAGREFLPSEQFTSNWRHIYSDIAQLEGLPQTRKNEKVIDSIINDILTENTDAQDISQRVEAILQANGKQYHNTGRIY